MRGFSYERSSGTIVFDAPNGTTFPVSSKAVDGSDLNVEGNDILDHIMFTMRSEPTEKREDVLDTIMFTMRSEPTEKHEDVLDSVMFTMRSEPTEKREDVLDSVMFTMRSEPTDSNFA